MPQREPASENRPPKRKPRKTPTLLLLSVLLAVIAALLVVVVAYLPKVGGPPVRLPKLTYAEGAATSTAVTGNPTGSTDPRTTREPNPLPRTQSGGPRSVVAAPTSYRKTVPRGKLIFIVDDVGNDIKELEPFLRYPGPLTLSIMPQRPYTKEAYRMILAAGKTPMLHQPMEADNHDNPGPGAIYTWMSKTEIGSLLTRNLTGMPAIQWVNNHMGSRVTSDEGAMLDIMRYLTAHNLHFLDSRTTRDTKVPQAARQLGLAYYHRNSLFLDDKVSRNHIVKEIDAGLVVARQKGYAVMIGHVWDRDLAGVLIDLYPRLLAEGYRLESIDSLVKDVSPSADIRN